MFCQKCGALLPEGTKFCMTCGTPVDMSGVTPSAAPETAAPAPVMYDPPVPAENTVQPEVPVQPAPVQAQQQYAAPQYTVPAQQQYAAPQYAAPQYAAPQYAAPQYAAPQYAAPPAPKPKKEKKPVSKKTKVKRILCVSIPAVVLAAVIAFNFSFLWGWAVRIFGSDEKYMSYVEKNSLKQTLGTVTTLYDDVVIEGYKDLTRSDLTVELKAELSDKFYELLGDEISDELGVDLSWFKSAAVNLSVSADEGMFGASEKLNINNKTALSTYFVVDTEQNMLYINVPELLNDYLAIDLAEALYEAGVEMPSELTAVSEMFETLGDTDLSAILPSEDEFYDLLNKYVGIVCDNLDVVEKDSDKLTAGGITEKCVTLTADVSESTLLDIAKAVLKEAKNDKDIFRIIRRFAESDLVSNLVDELGVDKKRASMFTDGDTLCDLWEDSLENAYDELCEEDDPDTDTLFTVVDYVNKSHEVIGRRLIVRNKEIYYGCAKKGSKFGFEAGVEDEVVVSGSGTYKGDVYTGDFSVEVGDDELFTFKIKNFDMESLREGRLNGTVEIPVLPFAKLGGVSSSELDTVESLDPWVSVTFNNKDDNLGVRLALLIEDEECVAISASADTAKRTGIDIPGNYTLIDENTDPETLLEDKIDFGKFFDNLKDCGVPSELVDDLESELDEAMSEDEYDDDYYDYPPYGEDGYYDVEPENYDF